MRSFTSPQFRALMRRNLIYRKRYFISLVLEIAFPVGFAALLLWIKHLGKDDSTTPTTLTTPHTKRLPNNSDGKQILSFNDYVTAILAKRQCYDMGDGKSFGITGIPFNGWNWQVPFVRCDSRRCQHHGEDAYKYCVYPILALAPKNKEDIHGKFNADKFEAYVVNRYPKLLNLPNNRSKFVKIFESDSDIEKYVKSTDYGTTGNEQIGLAVVFEGQDYQYTIRVNSTNINAPESEGRPAMPTTPDTSRLFNSYARSDDDSCIPLGGTPKQGPLENSCFGQYVYNGFLTLQRLLHDWIIEATGAKEKGFFVAEHGVRYVQFPSKPYEAKGFYEQLTQFMPLLMTLGILYPCATMTSYVTHEKELRAKELMKVMGVTDWHIGSSWFVSFWPVHIVSATLVTIISGILFQNSQTIYLLYFWQLCFLGFVNLSLLMSTLCSKTTRGVLFLILFVFVGFFLTAVADVETGNPSVISAISLHPIGAMSYALQEIGRLEDVGVGLTASSIRSTDSPSGYTFVDGLWNLLNSSLVLGCLTWYLNRAIQPDYGQALPLWFPLTLEYWFPGMAQRDEDGSAYEYENLAEGIPLEPVSDLLQQQAQNKENIEIRNLRKNFGDKVAVEGLNLSIYSGQVTALLGQNGAGKTTTIGMLTGALSPTDGSATILGKDIRKDLNQIRSNIGICFQQDVLFPKLTVREHVVFFCRLRGVYDNLPLTEAEASVDQAIRDVALEEKSNTYSQNLSGGMKRKLSLAMAFCGGSRVVILDEPTSGIDPFARRFIWDIIRQFKRDRCIILTTHFMDEADILGDRIAIMAEGRLRCCGSSLFLKRTYGAGYCLSIELLDNSTEATDDKLKSVVMSSLPGATLLSNVGTEMSFQLPINASDRFARLLDHLDGEAQSGRIKTYGVNMTTLDEVFLQVSRGDSVGRHDYQSNHLNANGAANADNSIRNDIGRARLQMDLEKEDLFGTHVRALLRKRALAFQRDKKAWCCTTIIPSIFVLVGLLLLKYAVPKRNFEVLPLALSDYNVGIIGDEIQNPIPFNTPNSFTCNPGYCTVDTTFRLEQTNETYYFCGGPALSPGSIKESCSIENSEMVMRSIDDAGAKGVGGNVTNITEASLHIFKTMNQFSASEYGGIFFFREPNSTTSSGVTYGKRVSEICENQTDDYLEPAECQNYGSGYGFTVAFNFTALHSAPLFQVLADEALIRQVRSDFKLSAMIHPLPISKREQGFANAGDAFILWFLLVLSFPFIPGAFASFVVTERETKSKHLQTVAGMRPSAYWISTLGWDVANYLIPFTITVVLMFAFDVSVFTTSDRNVLDGVLCLLLLFGPAAAGAAYILSFCFTSPSVCNVFIIISGFTVGMGASIASLLLQFIGRNPFRPRQNLVTISKIIQFVGRFFPPFCLGKGLLYVINLDAFDFFNGGKKVDVFGGEILLWECIYLAIESLVYPVLAIWIDTWSTNPEVMYIVQRLLCFRKRPSELSAVAPMPDDGDVHAEKQRVLNGQADNDAVILRGLTKIYHNGKLAVDQLSLGIPSGQVLGLLGINGAGKTTTMAMLTAEFPPSAGDATLAGFSLRHEPEKTRRRIGYCPQFDALFPHLSGREHVELYSHIKGIPKEWVRAAAAAKLAQVGLGDADSDRLSASYSGGMKRRLSLACAMIGDPQLMLLDECSTGVDPVARRDIWQMVSDFVTQDSPGNCKPSVILTTHSMEECEALCARIGIMANGNLRCLGSSQHLKAKFGRGYQLEAKVATANTDDEDFQSNLISLARLKGTVASDEESAAADFGAQVYFNLPDCRAALQLLTGDDCLSSMIGQADPVGYGIYRDATSVGVSLLDLASFAVNEIRIQNLHSFLLKKYPGVELRERQDMKLRFEISSEKNLRIASIFTSIENNKELLKLIDYGVSQTSLEQVFNLHAAEAERLKQGRVDG